MPTTYTKLRDGSWGLRSTQDAAPGLMLTVTKKDGTTKRETVAHKLWSDGKVYLYAIVKTSATDSYGNNIRSGASYRSGVTAPRGRVCPMCGSRECSKAWNPNDLCDED